MKIKIRRFSHKGSETVVASVKEAEKTLQDYLDIGAMIVDEDTNERIYKVTSKTRNILVVDRIVGG